MLTDAEIEQRRAAGRSRAKKFTAASQAAARSHVKRESLVAAARAGNQACIEKYGPAVHSRRVAEWRKNRPTGLMRKVLGWLDSAWMTNYSSEVELVPGKAYGDIVFYLPEQGWIDFECDGAHWHEMPGRAEHDRRRDDLVRAAGYTVIRLSEADIESGAAKEVLSKLLGIDL